MRVQDLGPPGIAMADAIHVARRRNLWIVWAIVQAKPLEGRLPGGSLMFERDFGPDEARLFGTAGWTVHRGDISFYMGRYDMTRDEAMADFVERAGLT